MAKSSKYKTLVRLITFTVITALVSENAAWAGGGEKVHSLAPESSFIKDSGECGLTGKYLKLTKLFSIKKRKISKFLDALNKLSKEDLDRLAVQTMDEFVNIAGTMRKGNEELAAKIREAAEIHKDDAEKRFDGLMEYYKKVNSAVFPHTANYLGKKFSRYVNIGIFYEIYKIRLFKIKYPALSKDSVKDLLKLINVFDEKTRYIAGIAAYEIYSSALSVGKFAGILILLYILAPIFFGLANMLSMVPQPDNLPFEYAMFIIPYLSALFLFYAISFKFASKNIFSPLFTMLQFLPEVKKRGEYFFERYLTFGKPKHYLKIAGYVYEYERFIKLLQMININKQFPEIQPHLRPSSVELDSGGETVNIGYIGSFTECDGEVIREAEKHKDINFIVIENTKWIKFKRVRGRKMPFAVKGYIIKNNEFTFADFKKPVPLHYIKNGISSLNKMFMACGVPTAGSYALSKITGNKDITTSILERENINVPENQSFRIAKRKTFEEQDKILDKKYGLKAYFIAEGKIDKDEVKMSLLALGLFIELPGIKGEIVIKPTQGETGTGIEFVNAGDLEKAGEVIYKLLSEGNNVIVEERIYPPVFYENGKAQDWNIRVFVTRDENDKFTVGDMVVRYDDEGVGPVNLSKTAKPCTLEDICAKLGYGEDLYKRIKESVEKTALKTAETVEETAKLEVKENKRKLIHSDFMGIDIIISRDSLTPYVLEANDIRSGGMSDLNNYLKSKPKVDEERINRSVKDYVKTMIRRGREFKKKTYGRDKSAPADKQTPPKGTPATLLEYMDYNFISGENSRKAKKMAKQRGGNDSLRTIQRATSLYVKANLGWFIDVFESYREDDILSRQGLLILYEAARLRSGADMPQDELCEDLFRVISYFRGIADMTGKEIKEGFPQKYFKKIAIQKRLWGRRMEIMLIDGCPKVCVFCPGQKYSKMKCMPYPLVVMLTKVPYRNIDFGAFFYEPLYYEDKCGALFHDVAKLFNKYNIITHGYTDEMKDIAQRNLKRIKECPKSGGEKYTIAISIHAADIDYFRLKKEKKKKADIISYYVEHYLPLIKELEQCNIKLRFMFPPSFGRNKNIKFFRKILKKVKKQIIKKLKKDGMKLFKGYFQLPIIQEEGTILFYDIQHQILSPRGYVYAGQKFTEDNLRKMIQQNTFTIKGHDYELYVDSRGMLGIRLTPDLEFSSDLFKEHTPADKQYVTECILFKENSENTYIDLLRNIAYLTESIFREEILNLLSVLPDLEGDAKRKCAEDIAEIILNNNLPVKVWNNNSDVFKKMAELKIKPKYKRLRLLSMFEDSLRLKYDPIAMQSVDKAGSGEKKGGLNIVEGYLQLLSAA